MFLTHQLKKQKGVPPAGKDEWTGADGMHAKHHAWADKLNKGCHSTTATASQTRWSGIMHLRSKEHPAADLAPGQLQGVHSNNHLLHSTPYGIAHEFL
eukprot:1156071-Pelagomonas_calceolata.AAC.2